MTNRNLPEGYVSAASLYDEYGQEKPQGNQQSELHVRAFVFEMEKPDKWDEMSREAQIEHKRKHLTDKYGVDNFWFDSDTPLKDGEDKWRIKVYLQHLFTRSEAWHAPNFTPKYHESMRLLQGLGLYSREEFIEFKESFLRPSAAARQRADRLDREAEAKDRYDHQQAALNASHMSAHLQNAMPNPQRQQIPQFAQAPQPAPMLYARPPHLPQPESHRSVHMLPNPPNHSRQLPTSTVNQHQAMLSTAGSATNQGTKRTASEMEHGSRVRDQLLDTASDDQGQTSVKRARTVTPQLTTEAAHHQYDPRISRLIRFRDAHGIERHCVIPRLDQVGRSKLGQKLLKNQYCAMDAVQRFEFCLAMTVRRRVRLRPDPEYLPREVPWWHQARDELHVRDMVYLGEQWVKLRMSTSGVDVNTPPKQLKGAIARHVQELSTNLRVDFIHQQQTFDLRSLIRTVVEHHLRDSRQQVQRQVRAQHFGNADERSVILDRIFDASRPHQRQLFENLLKDRSNIAQDQARQHGSETVGRPASATGSEL